MNGGWKHMSTEDDRHKQIVDSITQIIITTDLQGKITFANDYAQTVLKCTAPIHQNEYLIESLLTGLDFSKLTQKEFLMEIDNSPQKTVQLESKCLNSPNEPMWIRWTIQRLSTSSRSTQELLFLGIDISREKQVQQSLKSTHEIQEDYYQLFHKIDGSFSRHKIIFDTTGKPINYITYDLNDQCEKILELKREKILGKPLLEFSEKLTLEPFDWLGIFSQVARTGIPISFVQYMAYIKKYLQIHVYSVKPGYFDVLSFDITENHVIEQYLNRMQKMDALNHMAKGIAHEFNNLLTVIMGNLSVLKFNMGSKHEDFDLVDDAEKASIRARDITAQMLTFSKDEVSIKQKIEIQDVIKEALRVIIPDYLAQIEFNVNPGIDYIFADPQQIRRVISNILLNAKEASPLNTPIQIHVDNIFINKNEKILLSAGKYIRIRITDHGIGIPKENLQRVFEPFFTTKAVGRGLGLSTALAIINHHQGSIEVESQIGNGTTFTIYLPIMADSENKAQSHLLDNNGKVQQNVLIMDDEPLILKSLEALLKILGFSVETAHNGEQAIEIFKKSLQTTPFDLVILDLTVTGGMGGKETIKTILNLKPDAKVLLSSGFSHDPTLINYGTYGFYGILPKPYDMNILKETLKKCQLRYQEK